MKNIDKSELEEATRMLSNKQMKQDFSLQGLEEKCKVLQTLLDKTSKQKESAESKLKSIEEMYVPMKADHQRSLEEVKGLRDSLQGKFELERKYNELCNQLEYFRSRYANIEEDIKKSEAKDKLYQSLEQEKIGLEIENINVKESNEELTTKCQTMSAELEKLKLELSDLESKNQNLSTGLEHETKITEVMRQQIKDLKATMDDMTTESGILTRKYQNELKEVRNTLQNDKNCYDNLMEEKNKLANDLKAIKESAVPLTRNEKEVRTPNAPDAKKDKVILEALSKRVSELERNNNGLLTTSSFLERMVNAKTSMINTLLTEMYSSSTVSEMNGKLGKDDIDNLKNLRKFNIEEIQILAEKTYLENLNLRKQLSSK